MERYVRLLNECGVGEWFIRQESRTSNELFFIKKKLDMRRIKDVTDANIAVYKDEEKDGKKLKGRTDIIVSASMSDEEIKKKIEGAKYAAGFSLNKYYELPKAEKSDTVIKESDLNGKPLSDIADAFVKAAYEEDNDKDAFINSLELFVEEIKVKMLGSNGTDVSFVKRQVKGEFVAQCKTPQDVETHRSFSYDTMALKELKKLIADTLTMTKDRATATEMPAKGDYDVLLSDMYVPDIFDLYGSRAHAAYIYPGYSNYEVGKPVQGEDVKGDLINADFLPDNPFNAEGIKMIEREFIKDGILKTLHGDQRLSYYLNIPQIGTYAKVRVKEGKVSFADMKRDCLHVVNFSDFQVDPLDGSFKGEIRLAYKYDENGNKTCLTGGSVNGNLLKCQNDLMFSKETEKLSNYEGPLAIKFKKVSVSGK